MTLNNCCYHIFFSGGKRSENFGWSEDNNLQDETDDVRETVAQ